MKRNNVNIGIYKYLIEYFDANIDLINDQYYAEFVMLRNFTILNNIIYDNDIYIIEKKYFKEYAKELNNTHKNYGSSLVFPIAKTKNNSYSNSYIKFNNTFNVQLDENNINSQFCTLDDDPEIGLNVYQLYGIENHKLYNKKIKCDKIKIYHPTNKKHLNAIIDISNYINGINFHYLCKPFNSFESKTETEIKYNNETYSEYIEIYFPNLTDLFKIDVDGNYNVFYKEDYNIVASTMNEQFINSILSNSEDLEHSELIDNAQIVPLNLLIQPYRIIEEYSANSMFNYNDTVTDDEKTYVKLYLKNNIMNNNNYIYNNINIFIYPYTEVDNQTNIYIYDYNLTTAYLSTCNDVQFKLMSRLGFNDGIISIISMFDYPNKSYFYNLYKDDLNTSPLKEAYKYYNNIDEKYYNLFINEDISKELEEIDAVESINTEIMQLVKDVSSVNIIDKDEAINLWKKHKIEEIQFNYKDTSVINSKISEINNIVITDKLFNEEILLYIKSISGIKYASDTELLLMWKKIMKETILKEYEDEYGTSSNFLGFKIKIATDMKFNNVIYEKNVSIKINEFDDFAFQLNNIFDGWNQKPEKLIASVSFYDRILGIEIISNLVIITKEWFKYLINDLNVYRLNTLSSINKKIEDMNVIDLANNKVNFINTIKCVVNKESNNVSDVKKTYNQKIIFKPIFYKVKDLQSLSLRPNINQNIAINLSEYLGKVETFKLLIDNKEYVEIGRNNIFVIFKINSNDLSETSGSYNITDDSGNYISSGKWSIDEN